MATAKDTKVAAKKDTKATAKVEEKKDLKATAKVEEKKTRGRQPTDGPTVSSVALEAIKAGKTNKEVLAEVKKQFPALKTGMASINWYRNKAREEDATIMTSRDITKARNAEKKEAEKKVKAEAKAEAKKSKAGVKVDTTS